MTHPIDQRLLDDGFLLGKLDLCSVLLMNDRRFPWFVLVPDIPDVCEIYDITPAQRQALFEESAHFSKTLMELFAGEKCNVAALGNMVRQLHLHHIVRYSTDVAWPGPIWRVGEAEPYPESEVATIRTRLATRLTLA